MEYEPKTYFTEHEADDVKGFTIMAAQDGEYRIAEKWKRADNSKWVAYTITDEALVGRVEDGKCEPSATITDDQLAKIEQLLKGPSGPKVTA